jgi:hypothetical protein
MYDVSMSENATTQNTSGSRLAGAKRRSLIVKRSLIGAGALAFAGLIPVVRAAHPGAQAHSPSTTAAAALPVAPVRTVVVYRQAGTQSYALAPGQLAAVQQAQAQAQAAQVQAPPVATAVS